MQSLSKLDNWDEFLEQTFEQWLSHCPDKMPVLMIDELPFFLDKLQQADPDQASALLDKLRSIRQSHPRIRMIFCGSLGLHIVLDKLHEDGYHGQPVNDVPPFEVTPLETEDAIELAGGLLTGEQVDCSDDPETLARSMSEHTSNVPFYIQLMVDWMCDHPKRWRASEIEAALFDLFHAAGDPGEFAYYAERIGQYYPEPLQEKALAILDILSRQEVGETQSDLLNLVRHNPKLLTLDGEDLVKALRTLRDDHYIFQQGQHWRFKLSIVRRWWLDQRGALDL